MSRLGGWSYILSALCWLFYTLACLAAETIYIHRVVCSLAFNADELVCLWSMQVIGNTEQSRDREPREYDDNDVDDDADDDVKEDDASSAAHESAMSVTSNAEGGAAAAPPAQDNPFDNPFAS